MTSAIPVRCSTNWAMKPHIGSKVNLLSSYLPVQWNDVKYISNNSYLYCSCRWKWSVIIAVNFPIYKAIAKKKPEKKSGLQRDSNPWPPWCRCDALPTELWSHTLGARSIYWVHISPCRLLLFNCFIIYCDDHTSLSSTTAVQIWIIISYILHIISLHRKIWTQ